MRLIDADAIISSIRPLCEDDKFAACTIETVKRLMEERINNAPTIEAVPVEIIKHYKLMWKSRAQSGHFFDRMANGIMAQAAEIMLHNHEMTKSFMEARNNGKEI